MFQLLQNFKFSIPQIQTNFVLRMDNFLGFLGSFPSLHLPADFIPLFMRMFFIPINVILCAFTFCEMCRILKNYIRANRYVAALPRLRGDFTIEELNNFDGYQQDGRILIAVNGNIYDVSTGKELYGPNKTYSCFAGRDVSRKLASFNVQPIPKQEYDDLCDLSAVQRECIAEWDNQFRERYQYVGKLLKNEEQPDNDENVNEQEMTDTNKSNAEAKESKNEKCDEEKLSSNDKTVHTADNKTIEERIQKMKDLIKKSIQEQEN